jgi:5-methylcytosine-specific restriction endonuclease McrA
MSKPLESYRTLLLDSSYRPIKIVPWHKALVYMFQDKVMVVEEYDRVVRSPSAEFTIPAVLALKQFLRYRPLRVRYCKRNVFLRDGYCCQYCGVLFPKAELTIDHVLPRAKGGRSIWTNVVAACEPCNHYKGDRTPAQAGMTLLSVPIRPSPAVHGFIVSHETPPEWEIYLAKAG